MKTLVIFLITLFTFPMTTYAAKLYRHVPFEITMNGNDLLVVDYDFAGKSGVSCSANSDEIKINYIYKGYKKTDGVPILLQNAHIPDKKNETLADMSGQFSIYADNGQDRQYVVSCQYADGA